MTDEENKQGEGPAPGRKRKRRGREPFSAAKETDELLAAVAGPVWSVASTLLTGLVQAVAGLVESAYLRGKQDALDDIRRMERAAKPGTIINSVRIDTTGDDAAVARAAMRAQADVRGREMRI